LKTRKNRNGNQINFYRNLRIKDGLGFEFTLAKASWCQGQRWHEIGLPHVTHIATLRVRYCGADSRVRGAPWV